MPGTLGLSKADGANGAGRSNVHAKAFGQVSHQTGPHVEDGPHQEDLQPNPAKALPANARSGYQNPFWGDRSKTWEYGVVKPGAVPIWFGRGAVLGRRVASKPTQSMYDQEKVHVPQGLPPSTPDPP